METKTYGECSAERLCIYAFRVDFDQNGAAFVDDQDNGHDPGEPAGERIHRLAKQRTFEHPELSYREALRHVVDTNPTLVARYAEEMKQPRRAEPRTYAEVHIGGGGASPSDPSLRVHRAALAIQENESCNSYAIAVSKVLSRDTQLAREYIAWTSND